MAAQLNMLPATENPWVVYEYFRQGDLPIGGSRPGEGSQSGYCSYQEVQSN